MQPLFARPAFLLIVGLLPAIIKAEPVEEAVRVYKDVQASVVELENAECSGTGIVIDSKGLILTNAHLAVSPLPFQCTVDVADGEKKKHVTFKKVEIVGFDPRLDLALLRIDPAEQHITLNPVVINPKKGEVGQKIYAIGNPAAGGRILTKTITSGMLGAVDREIDGDLFYQIDASINPGNSGGPICDKNGQVLGLVTFKFSDAENVGFAIPLQDLKTSSFIPLLERKANPKLAAEIIALGKKFHEKANETGKKVGMESDARKRLDAYAFVMYRSALVYDPSNADIYSAIGDLSTFLGMDEISVAYFTRFFRMNAWHGPGFYVDMGFSLGQLKREADQKAVWEEGLAKYPWYGLLWQNMSNNHWFYKNHPQAAWSYAMTIFLGPTKNRIEIVQRRRTEELNQLSPDERKDFDAKDNDKARVAFLDHMVDASNLARKNREVYMTKAFADLISRLDGPPLATARDHIPQKPEERPARFKDAAPPAAGQ